MGRGSWQVVTGRFSIGPSEVPRIGGYSTGGWAKMALHHGVRSLSPPRGVSGRGPRPLVPYLRSGPGGVRAMELAITKMRDDIAELVERALPSLTEARA
jgi:hypothetical protein